MKTTYVCNLFVRNNFFTHQKIVDLNFNSKYIKCVYWNEKNKWDDVPTSTVSIIPHVMF